MKKRSLAIFMALVMVVSFMLATVTLVYAGSMDGVFTDYPLFSNDATFGTLKLRNTKSASFGGVSFDAESKYRWKTMSGTNDQIQNWATLKITSSISLAAIGYPGFGMATASDTFYGNNISTTTSRTVSAGDDANGSVAELRADFYTKVSSTMFGTIYLDDHSVYNIE